MSAAAGTGTACPRTDQHGVPMPGSALLAHSEIGLLVRGCPRPDRHRVSASGSSRLAHAGISTACPRRDQHCLPIPKWDCLSAAGSAPRVRLGIGTACPCRDRHRAHAGIGTVSMLGSASLGHAGIGIACPRRGPFELASEGGETGNGKATRALPKNCQCRLVALISWAVIGRFMLRLINLEEVQRTDLQGRGFVRERSVHSLQSGRRIRMISPWNRYRISGLQPG